MRTVSAAPTKAAPTPSRSAGSVRRDDTRLASWFILPALLGCLVFLVWPTLRGI